MTVRDHPAAVLTRHFFTSLFDFGVLSDEGADSLKRLLLGGLSLAIALGLLLTRVFMAKYAMLAGGPAEAYLRAVVADHAFIMAVPMWIVAAAMTLAGQSLFPDETDFRILMAEPLSRRIVFGAKLAALLLYGSLFVIGCHVGLLPLAALTMLGAAKAGSVGSAALALAVSSLAASLCAALSIVAIHGLVVLLGSRRRLLMVSGLVRVALIGGLMLALPLVARLPAAAGAFARDAWWLAWAPPAWFVGLERWLVGDAHRGPLAVQGIVATAVAVAITAVAYLALYRRFDRVTYQAAASTRAVGRERGHRGWPRGAPVDGAVRRFVALTLRRSLLHQGLVVGLLAAAGGLVLNSVIGVSWREVPHDVTAAKAAGDLLLWAPMTFVFLAVPAIRLALSIPMTLRANWIFRMAEDVDGRAEVARAGTRAVAGWGVALPIALTAPLQWWVGGPAALAAIVVQAAVGWLLVERYMADWRRVPFTCSYIPGKGFVPQMCVKAFASYVVFSVATALAVRASVRDYRVALAIASVVGATAFVLARRRARHARDAGLLFDEQLPTELTPLRLSAD
jgi:hypothetical protein